jgi:hypothetical protein
MPKKKKRWQYCSAIGGSHGTMICTACQKKVTEGDYRVYETEEAYHVQHRACSKFDPKWTELDDYRTQQINNIRERLAAYTAFRDEWNESALNDEIADMQRILDSDSIRAHERALAAPAVPAEVMSS